MGKKQIRQLWLMVLLGYVFIGCHVDGSLKRGMLNENVYYSSKNPNIKIIVDTEYIHEEDKDGYDHKFFNNKKHRLIYIDYNPPYHNQRRIKYYYNPKGWIFNELTNSIKLDLGEMNLLGKTWHYRDCVYKPTTANCLMIRDLCRFTSNYGVLKILYIIELPPYTCSQWNDSGNLTDEQLSAYNGFLEEFGKDIKIVGYPIEKRN